MNAVIDSTAEETNAVGRLDPTFEPQTYSTSSMLFTVPQEPFTVPQELIIEGITFRLGLDTVEWNHPFRSPAIVAYWNDPVTLAPSIYWERVIDGAFLNAFLELRKFLTRYAKIRLETEELIRHNYQG